MAHYHYCKHSIEDIKYLGLLEFVMGIALITARLWETSVETHVGQ